MISIVFLGVPISAQWNQKGYYYPIQIAQYGLSHYSKYLGDKSHTVTLLEDGEDVSTMRWVTTSQGGSVACVYDQEVHSHVINFDTTGMCSVPSKPCRKKIIII